MPAHFELDCRWVGQPKPTHLFSWSFAFRHRCEGEAAAGPPCLAEGGGRAPPLLRSEHVLSTNETSLCALVSRRQCATFKVRSTRGCEFDDSWFSPCRVMLVTDRASVERHRGVPSPFSPHRTAFDPSTTPRRPPGAAPESPQGNQPPLSSCSLAAAC